jgi:hypothetical protein
MPHLALPLARLLLSSLPTYKIGFPGWPDPNLDSVPVFWGVSSKKGACTSPFFHLHRYSLLVVGRCGISASRECVVEVVQFGGPDPFGPFLFFKTAPTTFRSLSQALPPLESKGRRVPAIPADFNLLTLNF